MQPIAITLAAIVGILVVAGAGWSAFAYKTYPKKTRWVIVFGYVLVALGGTGFFGLMFSSVGGASVAANNFRVACGIRSRISNDARWNTCRTCRTGGK